MLQQQNLSQLVTLSIQNVQPLSSVQALNCLMELRMDLSMGQLIPGHYGEIKHFFLNNSVDMCHGVSPEKK